MAGESGLKKVSGSGLFSGFWNMLRKENSRWWNTRRWIVQSAVWLLLLNGIVALPLYFGSGVTVMGEAPDAGGPTSYVQLFFTLMSTMTPFGVMVLTQSDVVEEKQSGTAEWVLSSPLSREAFLLSKLVVNYAWIIAVLVLLQTVAFEALLAVFGKQLTPILPLLSGLAIQGLHLLFWLTLSLMLGAFFKGRGPVLGIPIILLAFQDLIAELVRTYVPWIGMLLPKRLMELATLAATGAPLYSAIPLIVSSLWSLTFILVAIWRFKREEF